MVLAGKSWRAFGTPTGASTAPACRRTPWPAFRRAAEAGYGAELDVHLTRDGRLVVIHDGDLERMCGVPGRVAEKTAEELAALRLAGSEEHIPLLEEVLPLFAGRAPLVVELKTDRTAPRRWPGNTVDCLEPLLHRLLCGEL